MTSACSSGAETTSNFAEPQAMNHKMHKEGMTTRKLFLAELAVSCEENFIARRKSVRSHGLTQFTRMGTHTLPRLNPAGVRSSFRAEAVRMIESFV